MLHKHDQKSGMHNDVPFRHHSMLSREIVYIGIDLPNSRLDWELGYKKISKIILQTQLKCDINDHNYQYT